MEFQGKSLFLRSRKILKIKNDNFCYNLAKKKFFMYFYHSMKIFTNFGINKAIGLTAAAGAIAILSAAAPKSSGVNLDRTPDRDEFHSTINVPPSGTSSDTILFDAPNPTVWIKRKPVNATIVVSLSNNILYKYNDEGKAVAAYLIASGKPSTPTVEGLSVVSHVETYPYKSAPASTKRRRNPGDYGPKIIILDKLDPKTGHKSMTGQFIHGNNDQSSIGHYASQGCIRMDNNVIKALAKQVKRGDIVLIQQ